MIKDALAILDIGTTKIVGLVGRKNEEGKLQIIAMAERTSEGVSRGLVRNINDVASKIKEIIQEIRDKSGFEVKNVYVGIAGQHITSRVTSHTIRFDNEKIIDDDDVKELIKQVHALTFQDDDKILHVFPQEFKVDDTEVEKPAGILGQTLGGTFHLSVAKQTDLKVLKMAVENAGLTIKNIILEPVASAEAVLTDDEKEAGVALVDIGGGTSDLIVFKNKDVRYTAVIPFGGNTITYDISEGLQITLKEAENLKIKYGDALPDLIKDDKIVELPGINGRESRPINVKVMGKIIELRLKEIIDTVINELKKSKYNRLTAGITITGGGALLKNIKHYVEFRSQMSTTVGKPKGFVENSEYNLANPKYATAVGLLKKAFEYQDKSKVIENSNLFDIEPQKPKTNKEDEKKEDQDKKTKKDKKENKIKNFFKKVKDILIDDDDETFDD